MIGAYRFHFQLFNDLERSITQISKSRQYSTLNISVTVQDWHIFRPKMDNYWLNVNIRHILAFRMLYHRYLPGWLLSCLPQLSTPLGPLKLDFSSCLKQRRERVVWNIALKNRRIIGLNYKTVHHHPLQWLSSQYWMLWWTSHAVSRTKCRMLFKNVIIVNFVKILKQSIPPPPHLFTPNFITAHDIPNSLILYYSTNPELSRRCCCQRHSKPLKSSLTYRNSDIFTLAISMNAYYVSHYFFLFLISYSL